MDEENKEYCRKFFPLTEEDKIEKSRENLDRYLELAWEIFEELPPEKKAQLGKPKKRVDSVYREFDSSQGSARSS